MKVALIAALAADGTIGHAGKIPWHISDDLKRFKRLTLGHPVIMGRKTFESIGKPLPGRRNIILTRQPGPDHFASLDAALKSCGDETVFIIGGAEVYRAALPLADRLLLTHVKHPGGGDTKFPDYDRSAWKEVRREDSPECTFIEYERLHHISRHV
jgi:dihydrofolate reductase